MFFSLPRQGMHSMGGIADQREARKTITFGMGVLQRKCGARATPHNGPEPAGKRPGQGLIKLRFVHGQQFFSMPR